eukprot:scaffold63014_cov73-Cyclotella_meneghiniana.AAC.8
MMVWQNDVVKSKRTVRISRSWWTSFFCELLFSVRCVKRKVEQVGEFIPPWMTHHKDSHCKTVTFWDIGQNKMNNLGAPATNLMTDDCGYLEYIDSKSDKSGSREEQNGTCLVSTRNAEGTSNGSVEVPPTYLGYRSSHNNPLHETPRAAL